MKFDKDHLKKLCEVNEAFEADDNPLRRDDNPLRSVVSVMTAQARLAMERIEELEEALIAQTKEVIMLHSGLDDQADLDEELETKAREVWEKRGLL